MAIRCQGAVFLLLVTPLLIGADVTQGNFGARKATDGIAAPPSNRESGKEERSAKAARRSYPFHGALGEIDPDEKHFSLSGKTRKRLILVTAETRVLIDDRKSSLKEIPIGTRVSGVVRKNGYGQEEAVTIRAHLSRGSK